MNDTHFGIIVGTDHNSFLSAVENCLGKGLQYAVHHLGRCLPDGSQAVWGELETAKVSSIREDSSDDTAKILLSRVVAKSSVYTISGVCFVAIPETFAEEFDDGCQALHTLARYGVNSPSQFQAIIVPFHSPAAWSLSDGKLERLDLNWNSGPTTCTLRLTPARNSAAPSNKTLVISPGNCRLHSYCILDPHGKTISWWPCN